MGFWRNLFNYFSIYNINDFKNEVKLFPFQQRVLDEAEATERIKAQFRKKVEERWKRLNVCDLCGKEFPHMLSNWDVSWPNLNFDFCEECEKDDKACWAFVIEVMKKERERQRKCREANP
jgi:hypothetical protein